MPHLQTLRGQIVDLRRHANVHLYWRGRYGPAERYELWMRDPEGYEHQCVLYTRTMPARLGHEVTLVADAIAVRGIVNWSTGVRVNYMRVDPPPLMHLRDLWVSVALLTSLAAWLGDLGMALFLPAVLLYFLLAVMRRYVVRRWQAATIDRALRDVQGRDSCDRDIRRHNKRG
ncbi:MAG TPA: hypothetical protein DHV59_03535 [Oxalobacteraceae bacterium]|nr:hypothetical protein [Oxalobacteraceae bacterium]